MQLRGRFTMLAQEQHAGKSLQYANRHSSESSKVIIIDADGESIIVVEMAGISARISNPCHLSKAHVLHSTYRHHVA